jgi:Lrp/AsnC family transcriptional regulator, leucine-responsive regulatory protein
MMQRTIDRLRVDQIDCDIISELLDDGRVSIAELGRRVKLSPPAVAERVKRLESVGIITGYSAKVDLRHLGYSLTALVLLTLSTPGRSSEVLELLRDIPEVVECHRVTGRASFCIKLHLPAVEDLGGLLNRLLIHGQATTLIAYETAIPPRAPPIGT